MTTLITAYDKSGPIGRCDARCYNAEGFKCRCICGGRNHGAGLQQAVLNLKSIEEWLDLEAIPHETGETISVIVSDVQIPMPLA